MRNVWASAVLGLLAATTSRAESIPPTTVATVDLQRYVGRWYEIAKIPNRIQKQCARGTTAEYTLSADGTIEVLNRCAREDGRTDEAKGIAKVADRDSKKTSHVAHDRQGNTFQPMMVPGAGLEPARSFRSNGF